MPRQNPFQDPNQTQSDAVLEGIQARTQPPIKKGDIKTILGNYKIKGYRYKGRSDQALYNKSVSAVVNWFKRQQRDKATAKVRAKSARNAARVAAAQLPTGGGVSSGGGSRGGLPNTAAGGRGTTTPARLNYREIRGVLRNNGITDIPAAKVPKWARADRAWLRAWIKQYKAQQAGTTKTIIRPPNPAATSTRGGLVR